ncbi:MAG TPA: potassium transporter Kup [Candidatus Ozemobacteraceae bacterium]|nr:potassium transporter Kup [Candidatus Ozemobacteraceae bacterium]
MSAETPAPAHTPPASPPPAHSHPHPHHPRSELFTLAIGALGVVYGDIGTSPLYSVKECFSRHSGLPVTPENILGIISLVFWTLTLIVSVKYVTFVLRADNDGEGGMMSLMALVKGKLAATRISSSLLLKMAIFGTSLLLSEGMITPAISVLSAIEGLEIATPVFRPFILPLTIGILLALFLIQKRGTGSVARIFGPIMLAWFWTIGLLGLAWVIRSPAILEAINPWHALNHFLRNGFHGFLLLGSVVLCVTGAEALYADMGHFGRKPIVIAWYWFAYPCLLLNYFGQGALLLVHGGQFQDNPFFSLAPQALVIPLVLLSTAATIIASQALISGAFSLTQQAMHLGYSPRLTVRHTSSQAHGQIFVPEINILLMFACVAFVLVFRESSNLAAAYGFAVTGTMVITSLLLYRVMVDTWNWPRYKALLLSGLFLAVDLPFLAANIGKIFHGGWVPCLVGSFLYILMSTWNKGRRALSYELQKSLLPVDGFLKEVEKVGVMRVKGTAVFMTSNVDVVPPVLLHHFKHNHILHERVIFLSIISEHIPEVPHERRIEIRDMGHGFWKMVARFGFMETPSVPEIFRAAGETGHPVKLLDTSFFLGRESLLLTGQSDMPHWRKWLFRFMSRNAREATAFFGIPPTRVLELGCQIEL